MRFILTINMNNFLWKKEIETETKKLYYLSIILEYLETIIFGNAVLCGR